MIDFGGMVITDSWGRDICLYCMSANEMMWVLPDKSRMYYERTNTLHSVTDLGGRITSYSYHDPNTYSAVCKFASTANGDSTSHLFSHMLLKDVAYPTGLVTKYEYSTVPSVWNIGTLGGVKRFFPIGERKDTAKGIDYNLKLYQYTNSSDGKYFQYTNVIGQNNITEKHTFNSKSLLTEKEIRHTNEIAYLGTYTYGTTTSAADYKLLVSSIEKTYSLQYSGRYTTKTTTYTYSSNKKADLIKIVESWLDDASLDTEVLMSYSQSYSKQNAYIFRRWCSKY